MKQHFFLATISGIFSPVKLAKNSLNYVFLDWNSQFPDSSSFYSCEHSAILYVNLVLFVGSFSPPLKQLFSLFFFPSCDIVQRLLVMPWKKLLIVRSFLSFIQMFSGPQMETSQLLLWNSLSTFVSGLSEPQAKGPESRHPFSLCWGLKLLSL